MERSANLYLLRTHLAELDHLYNGTSKIPGMEKTSVEPELIKEIQSKIKDLHFKQLELEYKTGYLNGSKQAQYEECDKPGGLVDPGELVRFVGLGMIGPFAISAVIESFISVRRKKESDHASKVGLGFMILGFILVILGMMAIVAEQGIRTII